MRTLALSAIIVASLLPSATAVAAPCWQPPVAGPVVDPFRAPSCPFCAGNRGIEFDVARATTVRSVSAGEVTYSGAIAGTRYVVVRHANGWKVTYGKLVSTSLSQGDRVGRGERVGLASGEFYFGLRVVGEYRDPEPYLGRALGQRRLVPIDGSSSRAAPRPRWVCGR